MDFLKAILGDDLYSQVESKVNAYNSDEANKDKQIRFAYLILILYNIVENYAVGYI